MSYRGYKAVFGKTLKEVEGKVKKLEKQGWKVAVAPFEGQDDSRGKYHAMMEKEIPGKNPDIYAQERV